MLSVNFKGWLSWQLTLICIGCAMFGGGIALIATVQYVQSDLASLAGELRRKTARVALLESLVIQQSRSTFALALDRGPVELPTAQGSAEAAPDLVEVPPVLASATSLSSATQADPAARVASEPARRADERKSKEKAGEKKGKERARGEPAKPEPAAERPTLRFTPAPASEGAAPAPEVALPQVKEATPRPTAEESAQEKPQGLPTPAEVAAATRSGRIEGVSADKAGVERLSASAVHLRGGKVIKVGGYFPSGERLMAVDAENGRVITNQRQILMFFQ